ncbi:MAG: hypothetical protein E6J10_07270 [Chloroflexi bacterium]|nr:MAG: hypothetical protein E6J10_07270 [Chloroflexota bacterium]
MNLYQQLLVVHERLEGIGAHDDTMELVEKLLSKSEAARDDKTNITQVNVLRHMLKMREAIDNYNVYNDLQELISERDETEVATREDATLAAYVDEKSCLLLEKCLTFNGKLAIILFVNSFHAGLV